MAVTSWLKTLIPVALPPGRGEAGDKAKTDWVFGDTEDYGDCRRCSFGRECSRRAEGRVDHGHLSADQIGHQCRQAIELALQPVVLDRNVLAFDVASFAQAFAECGHISCIGRSDAQKRDKRQCCLLRARSERPCYCGSHSLSEIASSHCLPQDWTMLSNEAIRAGFCDARNGSQCQFAMQKLEVADVG